jgi:hypothetical protein
MTKKLTRKRRVIPYLVLLYIFLVDGERGGIGKSTFSRILHQWLIDKGIKVIGFDCDPSNQSFADYYKDGTIRHTQFSVNDKKSWQPDIFIETVLAEQGYIVGDLPAQTNEAQLAYFTKSVFRTAERYNVQFWKFFLCADYYSAEQFVDSHKALGDNIPHVLVLNEGLCDDFSFLDDYDEFQELYKEHPFPIITLPKIEYRECQVITTYRLSYAEALESEHLTVVGRHRIADLLMDCYEQLDELKLFQNEE